MADGTKIEWASAGLGRGASWNPIRARNRKTGKIGWHCTHDSEGCRFCYSEAFNLRLGTGLPYKPGHEKDIEIFLDEKTLLQPLHWRAPRGIFCGSMTDLFGDFVTDAMLDHIFAVAALCPQHRFLFLTKRPDRMRDYIAARAGMGNADICRAINQIPAKLGNRHGALEVPLPNVWLGTSVEDQVTADARILHLLATPAAVRFVSAEPLLSAISFNGCCATNEPPRADYCNGCNRGWPRLRGLDWVIIGGESGPNARPMQVGWARVAVEQCRAAGVACFVKQMGADPRWEDDTFVHLPDRKGGNMDEWPEDLRIREFPQ